MNNANKTLATVVAMPGARRNTGRTRGTGSREYIDEVIGLPPRSLSAPGKARWYDVASRYPSAKPSTRGYLLAYIEVWEDARKLHHALSKVEDPLERYGCKAYARLSAMRKAMTTTLGQMATDIGRKS